MAKNKTRTRRKRRATKAILNFGRAAAPTHKSRSGRTGKVRYTQRKGLRRKRGSGDEGEL